MAKWAARFALPLSNSMPGLRLKVDNVKFVDDIRMSPNLHPIPSNKTHYWWAICSVRCI